MTFAVTLFVKKYFSEVVPLKNNINKQDAEFIVLRGSLTSLLSAVSIMM